MGTANSYGQLTQQSWTLFLLGQRKPPKEQKSQKRKMMKSCSSVTWRAGKKKMVHWLLYCRSGGRNSSWLCVQEKMLLVSSCHNLYNCATLLMSDRIDVATVITEWLHASLLMTNESQNMRKSEASHAVISNKSLDFNTCHSLHLHSYTEKKKKRFEKTTPQSCVRSCATLFCPSPPMLYNVLL